MSIEHIIKLKASDYAFFITEMYDEELNDLTDIQADKFEHNKYQNRHSKLQMKLYNLWLKTGSYVWDLEQKRFRRKYISVSCQTDRGHIMKINATKVRVYPY